MSGLVVVAIVFMSTYLHEILKVDNAFISKIMLPMMLCNVITIYFTGRLAIMTPAFWATQINYFRR